MRRPGPALQRAVLVVGALLAGALLTGDAGLVVLATPLLVGTLAALLAGDAVTGGGPNRRLGGWLGRRAPAEPVTVTAAPRVAGQGQRVPVEVAIENADGAQLAVVAMPDGTTLPQGQVVAAAVKGGEARVSAVADLQRWGMVTAARPDVLLVGPDALLLTGPWEGPERRVAVLPAVERVPAAPLPPRAAGLVGAHLTRRPGDGSELLDVREYRPGDRMRRIDWRVSARRGALHVRRTAVDADAEVVLCLDSRHDVSDDVATWPSPPGLGARGTTRPGSSLDVAVRATASVAEAFLRQGDRVSFLDLTRPRLGVPAGTGVRHLRRLRRQLAEVAVDAQARKLLVRPGAVRPSAVVVLVSPMLDEAIADLAVAMRRRGRELLVIDVLPSPLRPPERSRAEQVAFRLLLSERELRLRALTRHGVLVTRWDPAAVPVALRQRLRDRRRAA
ncbi:MAG TPA: DUF58 domain-containing protein [Actinomycetales bacterium]|nr:DUF58 domain-containing protein [Actinomycetales bacterium]